CRTDSNHSTRDAARQSLCFFKLRNRKHDIKPKRLSAVLSQKIEKESIRTEWQKKEVSVYSRWKRPRIQVSTSVARK
ncbi:MAG: hypothetical protein ACRC6H_08830, partial [Culicoidibacterales bacterium]